MSETQARCRPRTVVGMSARHAEEPDESTPPELDRQGHEVAALLDAARDLASTRELRPLLQVLLDRLKRLVDYAGTSIWELQGHELTFLGFHGPSAFDPEVARRTRFDVRRMEPHWSHLAQGQPIRMPEIWDGSDVARMFRDVVGGSAMRPSLSVITSLMWVPLVVREKPIGLLSLTSPRSDVFSARDAALALAIARQAAVAIENARLHEQARRVAVLEERQRLARELHDAVTQSLYGLSLYTEAAGQALATRDLDRVATNVAEIRDTAQEALAEMRLLLFDLRPPLLEERGLAGALEVRLHAVEARAGRITDFQGHESERLQPSTEQELYRIAQEALNNVLKHAHAQHVDVRLEVSLDCATLEIVDDGIGFELAPGVDGLGFPGMRERADRLGGTLRVESSPGAGTRVFVEVPR